jgi:ribonuclease Z
MTAVVRRLSGDSLLMIAPNGSKILINCQEGCQRSFLEYSQRLSTVNCICLASARVEDAGGLPGALLTILDDGCRPELSTTTPTKSVQIIGPSPSTGSLVHSLRHFMNLKQRVQVVEPPPTLEEPVQTSYYSIRMLLPEQQLQQQLQQQQQSLDPESSRKRPRSGSSAANNEAGNKNKVSFVFQTPRIPGKFQPDQAKQLGVPKGPLFASLCKGNSVTLSDGTVIASSQVMTADRPPLSILVLHYDDESPALMQSAAAAVIDTTIELVVHMVPSRALFERYGKAVWPDAVYQQCHVINAPHPLPTARRAAEARSLLCSSIYSTLPNDNDRIADDDMNHEQQRWEYVLMPRKGAGWKMITDEDDGPIVTPAALVESTGALALAQSIIVQQQHSSAMHNNTMHTKDDCDDERSNNNNSSNNQEAITFLGTGCAIPCKFRNVSGIYVEPHGLALDVGEGTWAQMQALSLPVPPRIVWISHPHADHHLGLLTLLRQVQAGSPILLIAPSPVQRFLKEYSETVDSSIADAYEYMASSARMVISERHLRMLAECGITAVHAVSVAHCAHAYAGVFDTTSRWQRLVYSGDCRPSEALKTNWQDCTVLIHEATFGDNLVAEAVLKKHSTVSEAVAVGTAMNAKHIILTHFSQRYAKAPPPSTEENVVFAHDYMRLTPNTLPLAKALTSAMRKLYPDEAVAEKGADDMVEMSPAEILLSTPGLFADPTMLLHN